MPAMLQSGTVLASQARIAAVLPMLPLTFHSIVWLLQDAKGFEERKLKEIKNGRLAMVAFVGILGQHAATGKSPIAALTEHLSNPWAFNFSTNGVSVPGL
jgi:hypothetical protein